MTSLTARLTGHCRLAARQVLALQHGKRGLRAAPATVSAALLLAAALTACAPPAPRPPPAPEPAAPTQGVPAVPAMPAAPVPSPTGNDAYYHQLQAAGQPVLRIDAQRSLIAITVRRGGAFARFGHDHLVAARALEGYVAPAQQRADVQFRLDQMTVDEAPLRERAGLHPQPSEEAIAGTRHNMLVRVLDAERYPLVRIHAERQTDQGALQASITLHGVTRPLALDARPDYRAGALHLLGTARLKQSDFGLVPFAVMGGALAVQDELEIHYDIRAQ